MAKLILSKDGNFLKQFEISKERTTIGRRPENDIVIDHMAISGVHAAVIAIVKDVFLEDLNSTNGTWVNGQSIKKHFLQNGDVIELGKYQLQFSSEENPQDQTAEIEKTGTYPAYGKRLPVEDETERMPIQPAAAESPTPPVQPPAAVSNVTQAISPLPTQGMLQVLNGPRMGKELPLTKSITTLGTPGVQVIAISRRPQGYFLAHVEGAMPQVNGQAIGPAAQQLQENDVIELAGTKVMFYLA